jgi:hypothetical protein
LSQQRLARLADVSFAVDLGDAFGFSIRSGAFRLGYRVALAAAGRRGAK